MSQSVFYRNKTKSAAADVIINSMEDVDNPDMDIRFKGYMHGGKGFALEVLNLESITEKTMNMWKSIIEHQGLRSIIETDIMSGKVNIQCTPERQKRRAHVFSFVYLSISLACIYILWIRHHQA